MGLVSRIGLDPEVAIVSRKTGKGRSAHKFMKEKHIYKFYRDNDQDKRSGRAGSEVERDGAAIEVRSIVASACRDNIIPYVAEALRQTSLDLTKYGRNHFKLSTTPMFVLDDQSLKDAPEDVSTFGCQPDINAYDLQIKSPECEISDRRRYTGGHIHASTMSGKGNIEVQAAWAILYDYFIAMPFVSILGNTHAEGEADRRQFYGQPGSFRYADQIQKIEFRTLSGRMLLHPTILGWVMGMMKAMVKGIDDPRVFLKSVQSKMPTQLVYDAIMTHDVAASRALSASVFKLHPNYKKDEGALANPMGGGGYGTTNPYFFEQSHNVFATAEESGLMWPDDIHDNTAQHNC